MNILYIHTHDAGKYFDCYGYGIGTPNIYSLAKEGTMFRRAYCASPTCSPSRAGLLTGMAPHSAGLYGLAHHGWGGGFEMPDYSKHLVQYLNGCGYETVLCGIQHEACEEQKIGYQKKLNSIEHIQLFGREDYPKAIAAWDLANAGLVSEYLKNAEPKRPFFLSFGMYSTHRPYPEYGEVDSRYILPPAMCYDTEQNRMDMAGYIQGAHVVDDCVGMVTEALAESGKKEETLVIFTTDHGLAMPHMKCCLNEGGLGVALILDYPGNLRKGEICDELVSQIDLFPTICQLIGVPVPQYVEGKSILPWIYEGKKIRDEVMGEVTYHIALQAMRCIRTERYRYVLHFKEDQGAGVSNIDNSPAKRFLTDHGFLPEAEEEELYDLYLDPLEQHNIAGIKRKLCGEMKGRLLKWMDETGDITVTGIMPRPETAPPEIIRYEGDFTDGELVHSEIFREREKSI